MAIKTIADTVLIIPVAHCHAGKVMINGLKLWITIISLKR